MHSFRKAALGAARVTLALSLGSTDAITMNPPRCSEEADHLPHPLDGTKTTCSNGPCWYPTSYGRRVCWYVCPASQDPTVPTMFEGQRVRPGLICNRAPPLRDDSEEGMIANGGVAPFVDAANPLGSITAATAASLTAPGTGDVVELNAAGAAASDEDATTGNLASWTLGGNRYDIERASFFVRTGATVSGAGVNYVDPMGRPVVSFAFVNNATICATGFSMVINGRCMDMVNGSAVAASTWYSVEFDVNWNSTMIENVKVSEWTSVTEYSEENFGTLPLAHADARGIWKVDLWQETFPISSVAWKSFAMMHRAMIPFTESTNKYKPAHQYYYPVDAWADYSQYKKE